MRVWLGAKHRALDGKSSGGGLVSFFWGTGGAANKFSKGLFVKKRNLLHSEDKL